MKAARPRCLRTGLAIVANDKLRIYDSTGLEFFSTSAVMLNPVLQTTPKQVLVFDRGDGSLQVYNSFDQVFALELEEPIINASLNDSGALIVAHKAEGYKSQLTLYDTGFNERYKWYSAGSYLLDVDVYGNCKQFAAAGITLGESQVQCEILLFDANDTAPYKRIPIDAAFVYDIKYMNKDSLRVITDTAGTSLTPRRVTSCSFRSIRAHRCSITTRRRTAWPSCLRRPPQPEHPVPYGDGDGQRGNG